MISGAYIQILLILLKKIGGMEPSSSKLEREFSQITIVDSEKWYQIYKYSMALLILIK